MPGLMPTNSTRGRGPMRSRSGGRIPGMNRLSLGAAAAVVCVTMVHAQESRAPVLETGVLPDRWAGASPPCDRTPLFRAHEYNAGFFIIRQSGCTNFEKPFLYLILGSRQALLVDTGAMGADPVAIVTDLLGRDAERRHMAPL